jgi:MtfA peptidase
MISPLQFVKTYWRQQVIKYHGVSSCRWQRVIAQFPLLQALAPMEQSRLRALSALFLHSKAIYGVQGLSVTEEMRLIVAAQATLPILYLDLDDYRGWHAVVLYPGSFLAAHEVQDASGVMHFMRRRLSGEAWDRGPVILSWEEVIQTQFSYRNVVIHELAHKLDMSNGTANGMPPLHRTMDRRAWTSAFTQAYQNLIQRQAEGESLPLDPYALESPAEFFAVASEIFFVAPQRLQTTLPHIYQQLQLYYRQDPANRSHNSGKD